MSAGHKGVVISKPLITPARSDEQASDRIGANYSVVLVRYSIAALVIGPLATYALLGASVGDAPVNQFGPLMMIAVALVSWICLVCGHVTATVYVLVYGTCAAVTGIAAFTSGVRSPVMVVYPALILAVGWLVHARAAIALALLTSVLSVSLLALELWGVLPKIDIPPAAIYTLDQIVVYVLCAALIYFMLRAYSHRLDELHIASANLTQSTNVLERAQAVAQVGSWVADLSTNLITPSPEGCQIFGLDTGTSISLDDYMLRVHENDRAAVMAAWRVALKLGTFDGEHRIFVQGDTRWVRQRAELEFDASSTPTSALGIVQEITERKLTQLALRASEIRYRTLIEWSPEAILVHRMGQILYANPAAIKLFGAPNASDLMNRQTITLIHPDEREFQTLRAQRISRGEEVVPMVASRFLKLDGQVIDVEVQGTAIEYDGGPAIHVSIRDITERKRMEDEIKHLAFYDALTQLPNRRLLSDRMQHAMSVSRRSGCFSALMFLDLDNFKPLNDTHGHSVGDLLLVEAANRLKKCVRDMDTVARFGGDEFVVLLTELDTEWVKSTHFAYTVANKIKTALAVPYALQVEAHDGSAKRLEHCCTTSIGLVVYPADECKLEDITKWADAAMYLAKEQGRDRIQLSNQPHHPIGAVGLPDLFDKKQA